MQNSLWHEDLRFWKRSVGVWACLIVAVVIAGQPGQTDADTGMHMASMTSPSKLVLPAQQSGANPTVTLTYSTLDLSSLNAASFGDQEF